MDVDAGIAALNGVRTRLPRVYADQLVVGGEYAARCIRQVSSKYGDVYVLESDEFQMFLPKCYNHLSIQEYVEERWFSMIDGDIVNGHLTPVFNFFKRNASDNPKSARVNPRPEKKLTGSVLQFFINFAKNNNRYNTQRVRWSSPQHTILFGNDASNPLMRLTVLGDLLSVTPKSFRKTSTSKNPGSTRSIWNTATRLRK